MQISNPGLSEHILPLVDGDSVLDFGCGAGLYGFLLKYSWYRTKSNKPFKKVEGIDSSVDTVNEVTRLGFYNKVHLGASFKLPFKDNSYDTVICLECVEHIYPEDLPLLMSELLRVCNKTLIISTPPHTLVSNETWCIQEIERIHANKHKMNWNTFQNRLGELHKCYIDASEFMRSGFRTYMEEISENSYKVKLVNETHVYVGKKEKIDLTKFNITCGVKKKIIDKDYKKDYNEEYINALLDQMSLSKMIDEIIKNSGT